MGHRRERYQGRPVQLDRLARRRKDYRYHVEVVAHMGQGDILARYSFATRQQARDVRREVEEIRVKQNHERVKVRLVREEVW